MGKLILMFLLSFFSLSTFFSVSTFMLPFLSNSLLSILLLLWNSIYHSSSEIFSFDMTPLSISLSFLTLIIIFLSISNSSPEITQSKNFLKLLMNMALTLLVLFFTDSIIGFYCFFELSLVPIFLLIMGWGYQPERLTASKWMLMYTLVASIPLLLMLVVIQELFTIPSFGTMNCFSIPKNMCVTGNFEALKTLLLLAGFLVKFPIFFCHTWLPRAHVEAPVSGSMILAAILLKLAGFGVFRLLPLLSSNELLLSMKSFSLAGGALISIICLFEKDMKKLIAYTSVSHMCFVIFGYLSKNSLAISSASVMMIAHGVCSSGLFSGANQMAAFSNSRSLIFNQSILSVWPNFTLFWFFMCLGNMGGPPSINFFGEIFCILAVLQMSIWGSLPVILLTFLAAAYSLILYSSSQYGRANFTKSANLKKNFLFSNSLHLFFLFGLMFFLIF